MDEFIINNNEMNHENYVTQDDMTNKAKKGIIEAHYQMNTDRLYKGDDDMQASAFRNAYTSYEKEYKALMGNKRVLRDDNKEMKDVKTALLELNKAFYEKIPDGDIDFSENLKKMKKKYEDLIQKCDNYINTHPGDRSFFGKGRIRKRMVINLRARAMSESNKLETRATNLRNQAKDKLNNRPTWINVLAEVRTKPIDLDRKNDDRFNVKYVGENSNIVFKIKDGEKTFYIKDTETYQNVEEKSQYIIDSGILKNYGEDKYTTDQIHILEALKEILSKEEKENKGYDLWDQLTQKTECFHLPRNEWFTSNRGKDAFIEIVKKNFSKNMNNVCQQNKVTKDMLISNVDFICKYLSQILIMVTSNYSSANAQLVDYANISKRNVATSRMAELLGIGKLVAPSEIVRYKKDGRLKDGILMQEANGKTLNSVFQETNYCTPETMVDFNTIELFDIICGQVDRCKSNIMVEKNKKSLYISHPVCIANEYSFGELDYKDLAQNSIGVSKQFEDKKGFCRLQFLDEDVVTKLKYLIDNEEVVRYEMIDLLNEYEIDSLLDRMRGAYKTIDRTSKKNTVFLQNKQQLNGKMIQHLHDKQIKIEDKEGHPILGLLGEVLTV